MLHSGLCRIRDYVAFYIMLHSGLCRSVLCHSGLCRIRVMSFSITSHTALCPIQTNVLWDYVIRCNVIWPTVCVSITLFALYKRETIANGSGPGLGICSSVFWANRSFFVKKWANERFTHSLSFGEEPERCRFVHIAHFWWATWVVCSHHSLKKREWVNH